MYVCPLQSAEYLSLSKPLSTAPRMKDTLTSKIIEARKTALNGFQYEFTTAKQLKTRKLIVNYFASGSTTNVRIIDVR